MRFISGMLPLYEGSSHGYAGLTVGFTAMVLKRWMRVVAAAGSAATFWGVCDVA